MTEHELPEGRQTTVYDVWAVYKDYDANAPDTETLVWCATEELAREACELLKAAEHSNDGTVLLEGEKHEVACPVCDGWEWCSSYRSHKDIVPEERKGQIARSLLDVVRLRA